MFKLCAYRAYVLSKARIMQLCISIFECLRVRPFYLSNCFFRIKLQRLKYKFFLQCYLQYYIHAHNKIDAYHYARVPCLHLIKYGFYNKLLCFLNRKVLCFT